MPNTPATLGRPGVYVIEQLTGPTPAPATTSPSVAGFAGEHWRGPTSKAYQCNSWADFVKYYGGFNTSVIPALANPYLPYAVFEFFANGGQTCFVERIVGTATPGSTAATTLKDSAATPQNTLSLTAGILGVPGNIGTWGNNLFCDVVSMGANAPGRFLINIYNGVYSAAGLVETWTDLSMVKTDSRYAPSIINSPVSGSVWVVAADLSDATAAPNNAPGVVSGQQFSLGTDCGDPSPTDRASAVTYGNATSLFDAVPGVLNFNMPGETTSSVLTAAITYSATRPDTFCVIDPPSGQTPAAAIAFFQALTPVVSNAAMYYPWQIATNPATPNLRSTILLPPGGFVLGQMVTMDINRGVWHAPAGLATTLSGVVQAERILSPNDQANLNLANVNALRTLANGNIVIWGARTMQTGYASLYVPVRRTLNYIEASLIQLLEPFIFEPNDSQTWATVTATCTQFLDGLLSAGAFPGSTAQASFYVICDQTNNTPQTISAGVLNTTVGLALLYPIEFLVLTIAQFQSGSTTTTVSA